MATQITSSDTAVFYRYSISSDTSTGKVIPDALEVEVYASLPTVLYVGTSGDVLDIAFPTVINAGEVTVLDSIVAAHAGGEDLASVKERKFIDIDTRTRALIAQGFSFAGKTFSLSREAQSYWIGAYTAKDIFTALGAYPLRVNTIDDSASYDLVDAVAVQDAYVSALGTVKTHLGSGTAIKDLVRAATTVAEVNAVVDSR